MSLNPDDIAYGGTDPGSDPGPPPPSVDDIAYGGDPSTYSGDPGVPYDRQDTGNGDPGVPMDYGNTNVQPATPDAPDPGSSEDPNYGKTPDDWHIPDAAPPPPSADLSPAAPQDPGRPMDDGSAWNDVPENHLGTDPGAPLDDGSAWNDTADHPSTAPQSRGGLGGVFDKVKSVASDVGADIKDSIDPDQVGWFGDLSPVDSSPQNDVFSGTNVKSDVAPAVAGLGTVVGAATDVYNRTLASNAVANSDLAQGDVTQPNNLIYDITGKQGPGQADANYQAANVLADSGNALSAILPGASGGGDAGIYDVPVVGGAARGVKALENAVVGGDGPSIDTNQLVKDAASGQYTDQQLLDKYPGNEAYRIVQSVVNPINFIEPEIAPEVKAGDFISHIIASPSSRSIDTLAAATVKNGWGAADTDSAQAILDARGTVANRGIADLSPDSAAVHLTDARVSALPGVGTISEATDTIPTLYGGASAMAQYDALGSVGTDALKQAAHEQAQQIAVDLSVRNTGTTAAAENYLDAMETIHQGDAYNVAARTRAGSDVLPQLAAGTAQTAAAVIPKAESDVAKILADKATALRNGELPPDELQKVADARRIDLAHATAPEMAWVRAEAMRNMLADSVRAAYYQKAGAALPETRGALQKSLSGTFNAVRGLLLMSAAPPLAIQKFTDEWARALTEGVVSVRPSDLTSLQALARFGSDRNLLGQGDRFRAFRDSGTLRSNALGNDILPPRSLNPLAKSPYGFRDTFAKNNRYGEAMRPGDRIAAAVGAPFRGVAKWNDSLISAPTQHVLLNAFYHDTKSLNKTRAAIAEKAYRDTLDAGLGPEEAQIVRDRLATATTQRDFVRVANDIQGSTGVPIDTAPRVPDAGVARGVPSGSAPDGIDPHLWESVNRTGGQEPGFVAATQRTGYTGGRDAFGTDRGAGNGSGEFVQSILDQYVPKTMDDVTAHLASTRTAEQQAAVKDAALARQNGNGRSAPLPASGQVYNDPAITLSHYAKIAKEYPNSPLTGSSAGWKLHLNVQNDLADPTTQQIAQYLDKQGIPFKVGKGGEVADGKGMTVYVGPRDLAQSVASDLETRFGGRIGSPVGDSLSTNRSFTRNISGRFDVTGDPAFAQYGQRGLPLLTDDARNIIDARMAGGRGLPQEVIDRYRANGDAAAASKYGDFYTGRGVPDQAALKDAALARQSGNGKTAEEYATGGARKPNAAGERKSYPTGMSAEEINVKYGGYIKSAMDGKIPIGDVIDGALKTDDPLAELARYRQSAYVQSRTVSAERFNAFKDELDKAATEYRNGGDGAAPPVEPGHPIETPPEAAPPVDAAPPPAADPGVPLDPNARPDAAHAIIQRGAELGQAQRGAVQEGLNRGYRIIGNQNDQTTLGSWMKNGIGGATPPILPFAPFHIHSAQFWARTFANHPALALGVANALQNLDDYGTLNLPGGRTIGDLTKLVTGAHLVDWAMKAYRYDRAVGAQGTNNPLQRIGKDLAYNTVGNNAFVSPFPYISDPIQSFAQSHTNPLLTGKTDFATGQPAVDPRDQYKTAGSIAGTTGVAQTINDATGQRVPRGLITDLTNPGQVLGNAGKNLVSKVSGSDLRQYNPQSQLPYKSQELMGTLGWDAGRFRGAEADALTGTPTTPDGKALLDAYQRLMDRTAIGKLAPIQLGTNEKGVYPPNPPGRNYGPGGGPPGSGNFYENKAELPTTPYHQDQVYQEALKQERSPDFGLSDAGRQALKGYGTPDEKMGANVSEQRTTAAQQRFSAEQAQNDVTMGRYLNGPDRAKFADYAGAKQAYEGVPVKPGSDLTVKELINQPGNVNDTEGKAAALLAAGNKDGAARLFDEANRLKGAQGQAVADYFNAITTAAQRDDKARLDLRRDDALLNPDTQSALAPLSRPGEEYFNPKTGETVQPGYFPAPTARDQSSTTVREGRQYFDQWGQGQRDAFDAFNNLKNSPDYKARTDLENQRAALTFGTPEYDAWTQAHAAELNRLTKVVEAGEQAIFDKTGQNPKAISNERTAINGGEFPYKDTTIKGQFYDSLAPAERQAYDRFTDLKVSPDYLRRDQLLADENAAGPFGTPAEKAWYNANKAELTTLGNKVAAQEQAILDATGVNVKDLANREAVAAGRAPTYTSTAITQSAVGTSGGGGSSAAPRTQRSGSGAAFTPYTAAEKRAYAIAQSGGKSSGSSGGSSASATAQAVNAKADFYAQYNAIKADSTKTAAAVRADPAVQNVLQGLHSAAEWQAATAKAREIAAKGGDSTTGSTTSSTKTTGSASAPVTFSGPGFGPADIKRLMDTGILYGSGYAPNGAPAPAGSASASSAKTPPQGKAPTAAAPKVDSHGAPIRNVAAYEAAVAKNKKVA